MNKIFFAIAITVSTFSLFSKKIVRMNDASLYEQWSRRPSWFKVSPLSQIIEKNPEIQYQNCFGKVYFDFQPFGLSK